MGGWLRRRGGLLYLALALGLLWLALYQVPLVVIWQLLQQLRGPQVLGLIGLNGLIISTMVVRWQVLLRAQEQHLPFHTLLRYRLAAFGVTYFTPGPQFGGEPLQVYLVKEHHGVPLQHAIAAVTMDKMLEMATNFTFLAAGVILLRHQGLLSSYAAHSGLVLVLLLLLLPLTPLLFLIQGRQPFSTLLQRLARHPHQQIPAWLTRSLAALAASEAQVLQLCHQRTRALLVALAVTLLGWGLMIFEFGYALRALDAPVTAAQIVTVMVAARVAFLLPMPAGIGALEGSLVLAMSWLHLNPATGLALSLLIRSRDLLVGGIGLWLGGRTLLQRNANAGDPEPQRYLDTDETSI